MARRNPLAPQSSTEQPVIAFSSSPPGTETRFEDETLSATVWFHEEEKPEW
jgi:hypothetical protein